MFVKSDDAEIYYDVLGNGPAVVLLHPFPVNHLFWRAIAGHLASRYQLIMPDLRGMGASAAGDGPATMQKHARDVARVCDECGIERAVFVGVSIGGYVLLEFWRQFRARVQAMVLSDTKAAPDTEEGRVARLKAADDIERDGVESFLDGLLPRLLGESTRRNRPDLVAEARAMGMQALPQGIVAAQRGMAQRPDSIPTLRTIDVPTLLVFGEEDALTPAADAMTLREHLTAPGNSVAPADSENLSNRLHMIPRAGHFTFFEQPDEAVRPLRAFLDRICGRA